MALFDIVVSDDITISDAIARQLNAGQIARFFDVQISNAIAVTDALPRDVIVSDAIAVTDSLAAIIIDTLSIANARALNALKVRIDFSAPAAEAVNNPALTDPTSYIFTPISPGATGIVPQSVDLPPGQAEPLYVEVNVSEHTNGAIYQVSLSPLIAGANGEVGGGAPFTYVGIGASPIVELVLASSPTEAIVFFDEALLDNPSVHDVANYVWDNGLATVAVKEVAGNRVTLQTTLQTEGALYNLTVRGIFGIVIGDVISVNDAELVPNLVTVLAFEEVNVTDQLQAELTLGAYMADVIAITDALQADNTQDRVMNDAVAVADQLLSEANYDRTMGNAISVADSITTAIEVAPESFFSDGVHAVYNPLEFSSLTFSGSDIVGAENTALPGTRDLDLSAAPPEYVADGLDGGPCFRFRSNEYGISDSGWAIAGGARPSVHAVLQAAVIERKSWFSLMTAPGTLRHWGYIETGSNQWRQLTVASGDYGAAVVDTPGLHQSGFPVSGNYTRLNLGTKASNGGTTGIGGLVDLVFLGSRFNDSNGLNYLDCDVGPVVVTVFSDDTEAESFARDYIAPRYPTIAAALP